MVVGAAKIRAHQQQMAEYQQSLAAEFGEQATGIDANTLRSQSQASLGAPSQGSFQKPPLHGSSSMPSGLDGGNSDLPVGGVLGHNSPYAKLQKLGPPPQGMATVQKKRGKKKSASHSQLGTAASQSVSGPRKKGSKKKKSRPGARGQQNRGGHGSKNVKRVELSEEDLSASAASHRDFLLQTLHNVRNQLANPSPLIVSGLAVDESMYEEDPIGSDLQGGSSIHMPHVQNTSEIENPEEIVDKSAALILHVFDLIDPEHDGRVKKLDFLKGAQKPEVQAAIRSHHNSLHYYIRIHIEMRF